MLLPRFRRLPLLLATSALLVPVCHALAGTTTISASQTTPVTTNGNDIVIDSGGAITITSGAAVTVNTPNTVDNQGSITGNDGNNMTGILVKGAGGATTITNDGSINITDSNPASTLPLTNGTGRNGILVGTTGAIVGNVTNSSTGTISVRGNNSAGILIYGAGVDGSIINSGTISVTGNNSSGILIAAPLTGSGNITINNTIDTLGQGSYGVLVNSNISGQVYVNSTVRSDGYFNGAETTTRPSTFDGSLANLAQSASAIAVNGSVGSGVLIATSGVALTYGSAPALELTPGSGVNAVIGPVTSTAGAADLEIDGVVRANGIYDSFAANALKIGGGGGTVTLASGVLIASGAKVEAISYAADAAAIVIGSGANVASLSNAGTITSTVYLGALQNANVGGRAMGILDYGGALGAIDNSGQIVATTQKGQAVALDLRADTEFVTVSQTHSSTTTAASIKGDILFGSKGAKLDVAAGTIAGNVSFGASANNALTLDNGAVLGGAVTQAAGGKLAVDVENGRLSSTSTAKLALSQLTIGSKGEIDFNVDPATGKNGSVSVAGGIIFAQGAKIGLSLDAQLTTSESFTLIDASPGALPTSTQLLLGNVPYFYDAKITTDSAGGTLVVGVSDRPFSQAGVLGSDSAYNAVFKANYADPGIRDVFNNAGTQPQFARVFSQMLPSYSGGLFEVLSQGADALARTQADTPIMLRGNRSGGWAQQFGFGAVDSTSSSPGYHGGGLGFAFGWEEPITVTSAWGVSASYMRAAVDDFNTGPANEEVGTTYMVGAYYRETDGRLHYDASLNGGIAEMNSTRNFLGTDLTGADVSRSATANWTGGVVQAHVGISYEELLDDQWYVRPSISGDYFMLSQGGRTEHNGGNAFDLAVNGATDSQGSVTGGVTVGMQFGDRDFMWRPEVMVGYKQVFGGPDTVTAAFAGGSAFTLSPTSQKGGAIAHIGIRGGNKFSDIAIEAGGEDRDKYRAFDGRIVARFRF
jgi:hypothetical protein